MKIQRTCVLAYSCLLDMDICASWALSPALWALSVGIFPFCISITSNFNSMKFCLCIMFWSIKYTFTCQDVTFNPVNVDIRFPCKICKLFVWFRASHLRFQIGEFLHLIPTNSLSSIRWYNSVLHFNNFKIPFHKVPSLHYVLVNQTSIYMLQMTRLSLLT